MKSKRRSNRRSNRRSYRRSNRRSYRRSYRRRSTKRRSKRNHSYQKGGMNDSLYSQMQISSFEDTPEFNYGRILSDDFLTIFKECHILYYKTVEEELSDAVAKLTGVDFDGLSNAQKFFLSLRKLLATLHGELVNYTLDTEHLVYYNALCKAVTGSDSAKSDSDYFDELKGVLKKLDLKAAGTNHDFQNTGDLEFHDTQIAFDDTDITDEKVFFYLFDQDSFISKGALEKVMIQFYNMIEEKYFMFLMTELDKIKGKNVVEIRGNLYTKYAEFKNKLDALKTHLATLDKNFFILRTTDTNNKTVVRGEYFKYLTVAEIKPNLLDHDDFMDEMYNPQKLSTEFDSSFAAKNLNTIHLFIDDFKTNTRDMSRGYINADNEKINKFFATLEVWYSTELLSLVLLPSTTSTLKIDSLSAEQIKEAKSKAKQDFEDKKLNYQYALDLISNLVNDKTTIENLRSMFQDKPQDMNIISPTQLNDLDDLIYNNKQKEKKLKVIKNNLAIMKRRKTGFSPEIKTKILASTANYQKQINESKLKLKELTFTNKKELSEHVSRNKKAIQDLKHELKSTFFKYKQKVQAGIPIELELRGGGEEEMKMFRAEPRMFIHQRIITLFKMLLLEPRDGKSDYTIPYMINGIGKHLEKKEIYLRHKEYIELYRNYITTIISKLSARHSSGHNYEVDNTITYNTEKRKEENLNKELVEFEDKLKESKALPDAVSSEMLESLEFKLQSVQKENEDLDNELYQEKERKLNLDNETDSDFIKLKALILKNYNNSLGKLSKLIKLDKDKSKLQSSIPKTQESSSSSSRRSRRRSRSRRSRSRSRSRSRRSRSRRRGRRRGS